MLLVRLYLQFMFLYGCLHPETGKIHYSLVLNLHNDPEHLILHPILRD